MGTPNPDAPGTCRELLEGAVGSRSAEAILFSGGLDTSVLAFLSRKSRPALVTVDVGDGEGQDLPVAGDLARSWSLPHTVRHLTLEDLVRVMPKVVALLRTFDPMELRNSIVVWEGLKEVQEKGLHSVMTGDGADELFAGYSFMFNMSEGELQQYTERLVEVMSFSSTVLAPALGLRAELPYLDPRLVAFARGLPRIWKIGTREGETHGKLVLRLAFQDLVPTAWRRKTPLEFGSGSTALTAFFEHSMAEGEFVELKASAAEDGVHLRDREHAAYYVMFRQQFSRGDFSGSPLCPQCGYPLPFVATRFCRTCGAYPVEGVSP